MFSGGGGRDRQAGLREALTARLRAGAVDDLPRPGGPRLTAAALNNFEGNRRFDLGRRLRGRDGAPSTDSLLLALLELATRSLNQGLFSRTSYGGRGVDFCGAAWLSYRRPRVPA